MTQTEQKQTFKKNLWQQLNDHADDQFVMVGDFSGTVNNNLDSQSKIKINKQVGKLPKALKGVWRKFNLKVKDFTFYSNRNQSHFRTDMIYSTKEMSLWTKKIDILPKVILSQSTNVVHGKRKKTI